MIIKRNYRCYLMAVIRLDFLTLLCLTSASLVPVDVIAIDLVIVIDMKIVERQLLTTYLVVALLAECLVDIVVASEMDYRCYIPLEMVFALVIFEAWKSISVNRHLNVKFQFFMFLFNFICCNLLILIVCLIYLKVCILLCEDDLTGCKLKLPVFAPPNGDIRSAGSALTILKLIGWFPASIIPPNIEYNYYITYM